MFPMASSISAGLLKPMTIASGSPDCIAQRIDVCRSAGSVNLLSPMIVILMMPRPLARAVFTRSPVQSMYVGFRPAGTPLGRLRFGPGGFICTSRTLLPSDGTLAGTRRHPTPAPDRTDKIPISAI
jgi:hypothetical protein